MKQSNFPVGWVDTRTARNVPLRIHRHPERNLALSPYAHSVVLRWNIMYLELVYYLDSMLVKSTALEGTT